VEVRQGVQMGGSWGRGQAAASCWVYHLPTPSSLQPFLRVWLPYYANPPLPVATVMQYASINGKGSWETPPILGTSH
jgi:hypothetical protein